MKIPGSGYCGKLAGAKFKKGKEIRYEKNEMECPDASFNVADENVVV